MEFSVGCGLQIYILVPLCLFCLPLPGGGQEQRQGHTRGAGQVIQVRDRWVHLEGGLSSKVCTPGPGGLPGKCVTGRFSCKDQGLLKFQAVDFFFFFFYLMKILIPKAHKKLPVCPAEGRQHWEIHSLSPRPITKMQLGAACCENSSQVGSFV